MATEPERRARAPVLHALLLVPGAIAVLYLPAIVLLAIAFGHLSGSVYGAFVVFLPIIAAVIAARLALRRGQGGFRAALLALAALVLTVIYMLIAILVAFIVVGGSGGTIGG
jgi:hypothetical protein